MYNYKRIYTQLPRFKKNMFVEKYVYWEEVGVWNLEGLDGQVETWKNFLSTFSENLIELRLRGREKKGYLEKNCRIPLRPLS